MSAHARVQLLHLQNTVRHTALNSPDKDERLAADQVLLHLYEAGLAMRGMKTEEEKRDE